MYYNNLWMNPWYNEIYLYIAIERKLKKKRPDSKQSTKMIYTFF